MNPDAKEFVPIGNSKRVHVETVADDKGGPAVQMKRAKSKPDWCMEEERGEEASNPGPAKDLIKKALGGAVLINGINPYVEEDRKIRPWDHTMRNDDGIERRPV